MIDAAAELRVRMGDRAGVWEFLRLFGQAWELPEKALERQVDVPVGLREAYQCCGVLDPAYLEVDGGVLVFHYADQSIAETRWGIPVGDAGLADPPTVMDAGQGWQPYLNRLSLTCVDLAMTAVLDQEPLDNAAELPPEDAPAVAAAFARVPLPDLPMWVDVEESPVRWYSGPGQLLRTHGDDWMWLWVNARTQAALDGIYTALPDADWVHGTAARVR